MEAANFIAELDAQWEELLLAANAKYTKRPIALLRSVGPRESVLKSRDSKPKVFTRIGFKLLPKMLFLINVGAIQE